MSVSKLKDIGYPFAMKIYLELLVNKPIHEYVAASLVEYSLCLTTRGHKFNSQHFQYGDIFSGLGLEDTSYGYQVQC